MKKIGPRKLLICNGCLALNELVFPPDSRGEIFIIYSCKKTGKELYRSYSGDCKVETPKNCPLYKKL